MNLHETSAKTGHGVEEMINDVLSKVYLHKVRPQIMNTLSPGDNAN